MTIQAAAKGLKLNLGCGTDPLEGWLNYDINPCRDGVLYWEAGWQFPMVLDGGVPATVPDDSVDEILASHLIEHIPHSNPRETLWFTFWEECWRALKLSGKMHVICPHGDSVWAWADPGHVRAIYPETFIFLSAQSYIQAAKQSGNPLSPYRPLCNFDTKVKLIKRSEEYIRMDGKEDQYSNLYVVLTKLPLPEGYTQGGHHGNS